MARRPTVRSKLIPQLIAPVFRVAAVAAVAAATVARVGERAAVGCVPAPFLANRVAIMFWDDDLLILAPLLVAQRARVTFVLNSAAVALFDGLRETATSSVAKW